ncbi:MAG: bifunctional UDP-N-acetylglucosamine diphosphorylase/glucosamine-1-phosphate N-acetyltransferase GlmU [Gammaproteobacteria bacterium]
MDLSVIILAAGQGTRMKSKLPKVLHKLAAKPLVQHVIDTSSKLSPVQTHLMYGHGGEQVKETITGENLAWVLKAEQLGTGHAVQQVLPNLTHEGISLILYGDVPCVKLETISDLVEMCIDNDIALLTVNTDDPTGYGRIVRNDAGQVEAIVEHKDANQEQLAICEINTGIMAVKSARLHEWLPLLSNNNAQGEFYLTDLIELGCKNNADVVAKVGDDYMEVEGINDRVQLAKMESYYQHRLAMELLIDGVTLADPNRLDLRGDITVGSDTFIDVNVICEGKVTIGQNCHIGAQVILRDCEIADNVTIKDQTIIEGATIGAHSSVGPFARIRPGAKFDEDVHVGNFVEVKNAHLKSGAKAGHLSYLGDATVGNRVNVGAGTITCNYDGANKHHTEIGDDVFVGSDTQLVAPVSIGKGVTIAAGATITKDVSDGVLVISRVKQKEISSWVRPQKNKG